MAEIAGWTVGIDVSLGLVRKAKIKLEDARGSVLVADATRMPFAAGSFDAVLSYGEPLSHIADHAAVLAGWAASWHGRRVVLSVDNEWNVRTIVIRRFLHAARSRGGAVRD